MIRTFNRWNKFSLPKKIISIIITSKVHIIWLDPKWICLDYQIESM